MGCFGKYVEGVEALVRLALEEDIGSGDATSESVLPPDLLATAVIAAREPCVVSGVGVSEMVFRMLDSEVEFSAIAAEGDEVGYGAVIAKVFGRAVSLLSAERVALNFLQRLSGIATLSSKYAAAAEGTGLVVLDTRKTTPGWRVLEKTAVRSGGCSNHRFGLHDMVMIKDNHRHLASLEGPGGIVRSIELARGNHPGLRVEVEADTFEEAREAIDAGADRVLLDNMSDAAMRSIVDFNAGRSELEASGGITLERIPSIAATGVDFVSVGALTHSATAVDIGMDVDLSFA
jgi:nicotinate-nucleotide pyrophosphorylase (carboxylating)